MGKRGPKPEKLALLFKLKYLDKNADRRQVAQVLQVSLNSLSSYESRLQRKLAVSLQQVSADRLRLVCPECLEARLIQDSETGETVCMSCGVVTEQEPEHVHTLGFDQTYALTNPLVIGKSLGDTLPRIQLYNVLAKAHENNGTKEDVPINQIRTIIGFSEPPLIKRMKEYAESLRKDSTLAGNRPICDQDVFSVILGNLVEKVGNAALLDPDFKHSPKALAEACFLKAIERVNPDILVEGLQTDEKIIRYVETIVRR